MVAGLWTLIGCSGISVKSGQIGRMDWDMHVHWRMCATQVDDLTCSIVTNTESCHDTGRCCTRRNNPITERQCAPTDCRIIHVFSRNDRGNLNWCFSVEILKKRCHCSCRFPTDSRLQLDVRHLSLWRRLLVNAYEVKAGIGVIAGKTVWSMSVHFECEVLQKALYKSTYIRLLPFFWCHRSKIY